MEELLNRIYTYLAENGFNIVVALIIFFVGRWLARLISKLVGKGLAKSDLDRTLVKFTKNLTYIGLLVFVVIAALARAGIETTQFAVVLGAAGLAIGLALQGSLANFAAGFLMIVFRPFRVGDFIEAAGVKGTVQEIHIFNTVLNRPDNVRVTIPNAQSTSSNLSTRLLSTSSLSLIKHERSWPKMKGCSMIRLRPWRCRSLRTAA